MAASETCTTVASDGVDFIYKNDAGSVFLPLFKQIANPRCTHSNKHFHEIRSADREEGNIRFTRDGSRQQRLSGARRTNKQDALWNSAAQFLKLLRLLQKVDNFLEFFLGFFDTGDIFKCHLLLMGSEQAGAAFAEGQCLVAAALHLTHEEDPESY